MKNLILTEYDEKSLESASKDDADLVPILFSVKCLVFGKDMSLHQPNLN